MKLQVTRDRLSAIAIRLLVRNFQGISGMKAMTVAVHKIVFGQPWRYFALAVREFL